MGAKYIKIVKVKQENWNQSPPVYFWREGQVFWGSKTVVVEQGVTDASVFVLSCSVFSCRREDTALGAEKLKRLL